MVMDMIDGGGPSEYFSSSSSSKDKKKSKSTKKPKLKKKPTYKIVTNQYLTTFLEEVNTFLEDNPDYEVSNDELHFKQSNHIALFKLKNKEPQTVPSKVTVK